MPQQLAQPALRGATLGAGPILHNRLASGLDERLVLGGGLDVVAGTAPQIAGQHGATLSGTREAGPKPLDGGPELTRSQNQLGAGFVDACTPETRPISGPSMLHNIVLRNMGID